MQGDLEREVGHLDMADEHLNYVLARRTKLDAHDLAMTLTRLAIVRRWQHRPSDAVTLYNEALESLRPLGPSDALMDTLSNLGNALGDMGALREAVSALEEARELAQRAYGPQHVRLWPIAVNLAIAYMNLNDKRSAQVVLGEAQGVDPDEVQIERLEEPPGTI
jgi:tetratricopeptide (TPR) repeat protein